MRLFIKMALASTFLWLAACGTIPGVSSAEYYALPEAEQIKESERDFRVRMRLMGVAPKIASEMLEGDVGQNFVNTQRAWRRLEGHFGGAKAIPNSALVKRITSVDGVKSVNLDHDPVKLELSDGQTVDITAVTEAIVAPFEASFVKPDIQAISRAMMQAHIDEYEAKTANYTVIPLIKDSTVNPSTGETVPPLIQAIAYADGVARVCDIDVPLKVRLGLQSGIVKYTLASHEGGPPFPDLSGLSFDFLGALAGTGLIQAGGGGDKSKAAELCTAKVDANLLKEFTLIGEGKFDEVPFLEDYLG